MKISITELENSETQIKEFSFSEVYDEFNKEEPITAKLKAEIIGNLIKLSGTISGNLILTCDLCLKEFCKEIDIKVEEFFTKYSLSDDYENEFELKQDGFVEDLNGKDEIDITDFVYQSVILNIPNKLVCDINCNGGENLNKYIKTDFTDPRLEVFKNIKIEKDK